MIDDNSLKALYKEKLQFIFWFLYYLPYTDSLFNEILEIIPWNKEGIDSLFNGSNGFIWPNQWNSEAMNQYKIDFDIIRLHGFPPFGEDYTIPAFLQTSSKEDALLLVIIYIINYSKTVDFSKIDYDFIDTCFKKINTYVKNNFADIIIGYLHFILGPLGIVRHNEFIEKNSLELFFLFYSIKENTIGNILSLYISGLGNDSFPIDGHFDFNNDFHDLKFFLSHHCSDRDIDGILNKLLASHHDELDTIINYEYNKINFNALKHAKKGNINNYTANEKIQLILLFPVRYIIGAINKNIKMLDLNYDKTVKEDRLKVSEAYRGGQFSYYALTEYGLSPKKYCSESLAENTAGIILDTYTSINRLDDLEKIVRKSGGNIYNRTLHHVIQVKPPELILSYLKTNPTIIDSMLALLHLDDTFSGYDPSDKEVVDTIYRAIMTFLGKIFPKQIFSIQKYIMETQEYDKTDNKDILKQNISSIGNTIEMILTHIISYLYCIHSVNTTEVRMHEVVIKEIKEHVATAFNALQVKTKNGIYQIDSARWGLNDMNEILKNITNILPQGKNTLAIDNDVFAKIKNLTNSFNTFRINQLRNSGSHYQLPEEQPSVKELQLSIHNLREFIIQIKNDDLYPHFFYFKSLIKDPELPYRVKFMNEYGNESKEYYFTETINFVEGSIYSITDITKNQISINPIVLEWDL
ncbi:MAG TPA: hypothetical protein PLH80_08570 [Spirochaetota bacterium]|nr:hypothetical protein [Spirochaetota bacterium]HOM86888.1 hypothetical protein [Spirochaetota bacterium]HPD06108.1 hypothetical protein [Spirochaetota bacterium]HPK44910.1 hypothetical protein [Spirochaetota bacterium]HQG42500.1 hypothetical protein [Spirochaetota bacterium]